MSIHRFILIPLLAAVFATPSSAQQTATAQRSAVPTQDTAGQPPINQFNAAGLRVGWWYFHQPARMGEQAYSEFGAYTAGRRYGPWYTMNGLGLIVAIENYRKDVIDGEAKYFEEGRLSAIGHFRGLNPDTKYDTVDVVEPVTGEISQVVIPSERGSLKHGNWRFYDPASGQLLREEEWQVGNLLSQRSYAQTIVRDSSAVQAFHRKVETDGQRIVQPPRGKRSLTR